MVSISTFSVYLSADQEQMSLFLTFFFVINAVLFYFLVGMHDLLKR